MPNKIKVGQNMLLKNQRRVDGKGGKPMSCDENPCNQWKSATNKQPHDTEKVDPPSLTDKQILIKEKIVNYAITNLPNEIIEMIFVDAINLSKNSTETYVILSQTCSRFNDILKIKTDALLSHINMKFPDSSHIHMKFPDSLFDSLPRFPEKIKVSVRNIMKTFCSE